MLYLTSAVAIATTEDVSNMLNPTPLLKYYFNRRVKAARSWTGHVKAVQTAQMLRLAAMARDTAYGRLHRFDGIKSYADFAGRLPVTDYETLRPDIMRMLAGESDILWPGRCRRFAQSSGTSEGKSKYIPVTDHSLRLNHYAGGRDVVAHYLSLYPDSRLFAGKAFILGGSFANELSKAENPAGARIGDLSAHLIEAINPLAGLLRIPSRDVALMPDWTTKLTLLVQNSAHEDVTNISGVPSWFMTVLRQVIEYTGADNIHDVWPNLEVFFHGGISFEPYREQYARLTDPARMRYLETYNASEGFFGVQTSREHGAMQLLLDTGVFYEFRPLDADPFDPEAPLPAWKVEQGQTYALLISSCNGLWRYSIGDTVTVHSVDPLMISIAGRTSHYINAFGEELMVHNADKALAMACKATGARVSDYTAAPVYTTDSSRGHHQWLIEWTTPPHDIEAFADMLDSCLCRVNSDYQAKRTGNIFLARLTITTARTGLFDSWLASTGKLGGQRKVPRLQNDRRIIEAMLRLNN